MKKKYYWIIGIVFAINIFVNIGYSVPAPFNEYYYNPETEECINHWRGDEHVSHPVPEGFYFSGYDDVNCTEFTFNLTKYQECKSLGGEYIMKSLVDYECSFVESIQKPKDNIFLYISLGITLIVILFGVWIYDKLKKPRRK